MNIQIKYGTTRTVLLIGKYAIKFPSLYSWEFFLKGLLGNMCERKWSKYGYNESSNFIGKLCPVLFTLWGGWFSIMPRCEELTFKEFSNLYYAGYLDLVEHKISSFGKLNGEIVAIDYGN